MFVKKALIMVDLQNDFCPGGRLAVPHGDEVIHLANQIQAYFELVIATQDWHPERHISFASTHQKNIGDLVQVEEIEQILWPDHCVQNSKGADLHPRLNRSRIHKFIYKGTNHHLDSYSAFFDNAHKQQTGLHDYLQRQKIRHVYILGLATDYCVKYSALDAIKLGYIVTVIQDACRGVELNIGDSANALSEMRKAGVNIIMSAEIMQQRQVS